MSGSPDHQVPTTMLKALRGVVSQPDLYLIKAAQASTLRELKSARTLLRDFNATAKQQLEQHIEASDAAVKHLKSIRQDLDYAYSCIRTLKQQLAEQRPELYQQLQQELQGAQYQ